MMKFSIIIPVYNVEQYLSKCLDSVLNQTYIGDYELICVNDGSTDGSLAILEEYAKRTDKIEVIDTPNGGTATARNIGIKKAKGDYIWFVDSDDWVEKDALDKLSEAFLRFDTVDMLCFHGKLKYENSQEILDEENKYVDSGITGWEYYNKYALRSMRFHFVCVVLRLYRREFILDNELFFEKGVSHEDNLWIPQVCYCAKSVAVVDLMLYVYRIREGSKMQTENIKQFEDIISVANKLSEFFIPKTDIDKSVVNREIAGEYFSVFMPIKKRIAQSHYHEFRQQINWDNYQKVSTYPRHRRIYKILKNSTWLFHQYIYLENLVKK